MKAQLQTHQMRNPSQPLPRSLQERVDAVFSEYSLPTSPGCAIAIVQGGRIVYKKGYGMANLECSARIRPSTVFNIASVSKQFTAFAIHLLAAEGKISLDDDVRKHVPELPEYGHVISARRLMNHTSGLRDQINQVALVGVRGGDVLKEDDILELAWRQKGLNFAPGAQELYCNTGYILLSLIVKRISGKPFRQFCQERIFGPLKMTSTHFHDDNTEWVKGRACSYIPRPSGGFSEEPLQNAFSGATSLYTTVEDIAKWERNFIKQTVGGPKVIKAMLERGRLSDGKVLDYASGLLHGAYRGLRTVAHGGTDGGYRAMFMRFPEQELAIILLANLGSILSGNLAEKVADIALADQFDPIYPAQPPEPLEVALDSEVLDRRAGTYLVNPVFLLTFERVDNELWFEFGGSKTRAIPLSPTEFYHKETGARIFFTPGSKPEADAIFWTQGYAREGSGTRITQFWPQPDELAEYVGSYYSEELGVLWVVSRVEDRLQVRIPRATQVLRPVLRDTFLGSVGYVEFTRNDGPQTVRSFRVSNARARGMSFKRISLEALGSSRTISA